MKTIIVTGTPGTGKTRLAKSLSIILNFTYIDVNKIIKDSKIYTKFDQEKQTFIVDVKNLNKVLEKIILQSKKNLIIDSHLSHYLPRKYVDLCIVTKCDIKILKMRLNKRKYKEEKLRENLDAEILDICLIEASENKHKIMIIDTSRRLNIKEVKELICQRLKN